MQKKIFVSGIIFIGILNTFIIIPMTSLLQERVPQSIKGRFFVFYNGLKGVLIPLSGVIVGVTMDNFSIYTIVTTLALSSMIIQLYFMFKLNLRKRHKAYVTKEI